MGYFFRPRFPNGDYLYANQTLFLALAKQMDAKKNKYSFSGPIGGGIKSSHIGGSGATSFTQNITKISLTNYFML